VLHIHWGWWIPYVRIFLVEIDALVPVRGWMVLSVLSVTCVLEVIFYLLRDVMVFKWPQSAESSITVRILELLGWLLKLLGNLVEVFNWI